MNKRELIEPSNSISKKILTGIIVRGTCEPELLETIRSNLRVTGTASLESMQIDKHAERRALLNLFVVKPKQTGFSSIAELTASAIKNPEGTAMLAMRGESGDRDAELDLDKLVSEIQSHGVGVYTDTGTLTENVNKAIDESEVFDWVDTSDDTENP